MKKRFIRKIGASFAALLSLVPCLNSVNAKFLGIPVKNLKSEDRSTANSLAYPLTDFLNCYKAEGNNLQERLCNLSEQEKGFQCFGVGVCRAPKGLQNKVFLKYRHLVKVDHPLALGREKANSSQDDLFEVGVLGKKEVKLQVFLTPEEYVQIEDLLKFGQEGLRSSKDQDIKDFMSKVSKLKEPKKEEKVIVQKKIVVPVVPVEKPVRQEDNSFDKKWLALLAAPPALYTLKKLLEPSEKKGISYDYDSDDNYEEYDS